jgi:nitrite reductase (NO-forming)
MSRADRTKLNRSRRGFLIGIVSLASGVALTSCGDESDAAAKDAIVVEVSLGRFVLEPAVLTATAGDLQLKVTNTDPDLMHDLVVRGKGTRRLAPGESQTLDIPHVVAGEYRMWCDVPGHAAAGQTGTLVVNPPSAPAGTSA